MQSPTTAPIIPPTKKNKKVNSNKSYGTTNDEMLKNKNEPTIAKTTLKSIVNLSKKLLRFILYGRYVASEEPQAGHTVSPKTTVLPFLFF
ncbi:MAG: hypothetical protein IJD37_07475 [Clostridia bacterium]|nr:hypothetical protein [Clostridia bacterium]